MQSLSMGPELPAELSHCHMTVASSTMSSSSNAVAIISAPATGGVSVDRLTDAALFLDVGHHYHYRRMVGVSMMPTALSFRTVTS